MSNTLKDVDNLIWVDCEMTGLNPELDVMLEIATIVTDKNLNILGEGPVLAISQSEAKLGLMNEWNQKQHGQSGLLARVQASYCNEAEAERLTLEFIAQYVPGQSSPICGNSVCLDKRFLVKYMPALAAYFHYRLIDVSTIKELARRWQPQIYDGFKKDSQHLAMQDIHDSIEELRYYRKHFFAG